MNIGVLGTGFGAYHAQLWTTMDRVDKVIIFGRNEAKLQELKQALGVEITTNIDDIMLDSTINVIDICLPSFYIGSMQSMRLSMENMYSVRHRFATT